MGPRLDDQDLASNFMISSGLESADAITPSVSQRRRLITNRNSIEHDASMTVSSLTTMNDGSIQSSVAQARSPHSSQHSRFFTVSESQSSIREEESASLPTTSHYGEGRGRSQNSVAPFFSTPRIWFLVAWVLHFACSILVLMYGSQANHGERKYIPVDSSKVEGRECEKAFVNVFSSSMQDPDAFVCCRNPQGLMDGFSDDPLICIPPPSYLPFARRLAKFPDAWILPLFPLLVRACWHWYQHHSSSSVVSSRWESTYIKRRLYLYLGLIQVRGWILYLVLDEVEDWFVAPGGEGCWYEGFLHSNYEQCQGRMMDFSDHVVLYFAQIIPIALVEILHALFPAVGEKHSTRYWITNRQRHTKSSRQYEHLQRWMVPTILLVWLVNLYVVTFLGAYKTAAYFHTGPEVLVGFLVSLTVQVPLFMMQTGRNRLFASYRDYFFESSPVR